MNRRETITQKLTEAFHPFHLDVEDESHNHNVPEGSESHFKVTLVCNDFEGESLVNRHRAVNKVLAGELATGVHALALHTMTPDEWFDKSGRSPDSPPCLGGDGTLGEKA
ncbi:MAG: BolA/IbaG family iron-sulfur metabolism protein [Chromatiales bacterium]|jgi:BolA protein